MPASLARFRLNGQLVDPALNRATIDDRVVQIEPKIMDVLVALAERPGEVVTRGELMARVWPGVFVTDDVLNRAIRELRRVFSDQAELPVFIETIRKRGYRLLATVERDDGVTAATDPSSVVIVNRGSKPAPPSNHSRTLGALPVAVVLLSVLTVVAAVIAGPARAKLSHSSFDRGELLAHFTPFTSTPGNEVEPALSATGRLAFVARGSDDRAHIFVKRLEDASATQLTDGPDREIVPAWSADGIRIAFARLVTPRPGEPTALPRLLEGAAPRCEIWIVNVDIEGSERRVAPCPSADDHQMSWSPDGKSLALAAGGGTLTSPLHLELLTIDTAERRKVTTPPAGDIGDASPAFSPDGRQLAFIRSVTGSIGDVYVIPVDGAVREPRRITFDNADVLGVDWEPDSQHLVFSSERGGGISLWRVALLGGEPTFVAGGGAKLKHPSVSRGDGSIAYEDWHYEINLVERPVAPDEAPQVPISPTSDQWNFDPQISPDGKRLAFQSTRSGRYEIWVADRDGSHPQQLTQSAVYKSMPRWSPDGRQLLVSLHTATGAEADVIDVNSRAARVVMHDPTAINAPSWSQDGRHIYFGSPRSGSWQIWQVDSQPESARPMRTTGDYVQMTTTGGYAGLESLDGRWLYYTSLVRRGLWRRALANPRNGNAEMLVNDDVQADDWANFGVLDSGFFFLTRPDDGDPIVSLAREGSHQTRLGARLPAFGWAGIDVSRDGTHVLYAHADRRESNITLLQFEKRLQ